MLRVMQLCALMIAIIPSISHGITWYVEKDGSGDFIDLQSAADAAASGDTIRVGPGRYSERAWSECFEDHFFSIVTLSKPVTTIIGTGHGQTIIGPDEPWDGTMETRWGVLAVGFCGASRLAIHGIQFENLTDAIHCEFALEPNPGMTTELKVEGCSFVANYISVISDGNVMSVTNCMNRSAMSGARFVSSYMGALVESVSVSNCRSELSGGSCTHISVPGRLLEVEDCLFFGSGTGNQGVGINSSVYVCDVGNTKFSGFRYCIVNMYGGDYRVANCVFENSGTGVWLREGNTLLTMEGCDFHDISVSSLSYDDHVQGGRISNCNLAKGADYTVSHSLYGKSATRDIESIVHIDMTNNWWGTTDPDSIRAWIEDREDDIHWPIVIDWEPSLSDEVSSEEETLGGFKAMFRGR